MNLIKYINKRIAFLIVFCSLTAISQNKKFVVVLDAGHGGKDYGAVYGKFIEKDIALKVVVKIGAILDKDKSIQVVYTRDTDVFIPLNERANIANKAHANFFISVHCNASKSNAYGTETFVMGTTKIASNLEVAKKENEVITLENDYKLNYGGYDPNAVESVIGLTMLQEEYLDQSIALASVLQNEFTNTLNRKNRGVKQAPFLVLHKTFMPSVLTELGFISNSSEGSYLNSEEGQNQLSKSIAQAIIDYKKGYIGSESIFDETKKKEIEALEKANHKSLYRIQIAVGSNKIKTTPSNFKGLKDVTSEKYSGKYKYFYGSTTNYDEAQKLLQDAKSAGYPSSFIVSTDK